MRETESQQATESEAEELDEEDQLEAEFDPEVPRRATSAILDREEGAIQKKSAGDSVSRDQVHAAAAEGLASPTTTLPHADKIQASFGADHDVSKIKAHVGGSTAAEMGANAYAKGNHVVFDRAPDLHTAAHEAAHVVQQARGVNLYGGVGEAGDSYEQHADAVADRVVAGQSAADLLGHSTSGDADSEAAVQMDAKKKPTGLTDIKESRIVKATAADSKGKTTRISILSSVRIRSEVKVGYRGYVEMGGYMLGQFKIDAKTKDGLFEATVDVPYADRATLLDASVVINPTSFPERAPDAAKDLKVRSGLWSVEAKGEEWKLIIPKGLEAGVRENMPARLVNEHGSFQFKISEVQDGRSIGLLHKVPREWVTGEITINPK